MAALKEQEPGLPERLSKLLQSRQEEAERRKEAREGLRLEEEQVEYFTREFERERAAVEALLAAVPGDKAAAEDALHRASELMALLQKFVADSVPLLPQYELRRAQDSLLRLQAQLNTAREEALPKKKFTFRARCKARDQANGTDPSNTNPSTNPNSSTSNTTTSSSTSNSTGDKPTQPETTEVDGSSTVDRGSLAVDGGSLAVDGGVQCGFSDLSDTTLSLEAAQIERRDVLLTNLQNCRVELRGSPGTLHLTRLRGCRVLCGPVAGSVFMDRCSGCELALACQQLRTHNSTDCSVYLHVTSRAIIEDCSGLRLAPFTWTYPGLQQHFSLSGLDPLRNNWNHVDDFNWLSSTTPSPNWTHIPEDERRTSWD